MPEDVDRIELARFITPFMDMNESPIAGCEGRSDTQAGTLVLPGRPSCEPFRVYNTQANGIYGPTPMTDEEWQSFSNWCPGDVIDIRIIPWGSVAAGPHQLVIEVPDAVFVGDEGNFPFSLYVQALAL